MQKNSSVRLIPLIIVSATVVLLLLTGCPSPTNGEPQEYEITLRADPTSGGSITGDHNVDGSSIVIASPGDEFSWEAVPAAGYVFAGWSSQATGSTTDNPLTYTAQASDTVTASFSPLSEVTISFDSGSSVDEDRGPVTVTLRVDDPPGAELDVGVKLSGTAVRGSSDDYTVSGLSGTGEYETATIPAGSTETTFEIAFVNDDVPEGDETIVVSLDDSSSDYTAGPDKTLTIVNDDAGLAAPEIFSSSSYSDGPDGPIYVQDQAETITITNPNSRGTVYYTDDDSDPASSGTRTEYTSAISITATTTIRAIVEDGAEQSPEATTTATFQLFDPTVQVNASDFTGGTVTAGDDVGFITYHVPNGTEVDQGATYYYTLDDSTPDAGASAYTSAFTQTEPVTVKVIAIRDGWESSNVVSADLTSMEIDVSISGSMADVGDSTYTVTTVPSDGVTVGYSIDAVAPFGDQTELTTGSGETITVKAGVTHQQINVTATKSGYVDGTAQQTVQNYNELFYVDDTGNVWEYDATAADVQVGSITVDDIGLYESRLVYLGNGVDDTIYMYNPYDSDSDFDTANDWPSGTITTIAGRSGYVDPGTNGFSGSVLSYLVDEGSDASVYHYDPSGDDPEDTRFSSQGGVSGSAIGHDQRLDYFLFTGTGGSVLASEDSDGDGTYDDPTTGNEFPNADSNTIVDLGYYGMGSGDTKQLYLNLDGSSNYELRETDASGSTDQVLPDIDNAVRVFTSY